MTSVTGKSGSITLLGESSSGDGAIELLKGIEQYYTWQQSTTSSTNTRTGSDSFDVVGKTTDVYDLIGSAGMVLGAIKGPKTSSSNKTLAVTVQNSSPHVLVPKRVKLDQDAHSHFCKANLGLMLPGESSTANFETHSDYSHFEGQHHRFDFVMVASNGKETDFNFEIKWYTDNDGYHTGPYQITCDNYGIKYDSDIQLRIDSTDEAETLRVYSYAFEGADDSPSFAIVMSNSADNSSEAEIGITFVPWKIGTVGPSPLFETPGVADMSQLFRGEAADNNNALKGAASIGKLAWNYLKRSDTASSSGGTENTRGITSMVAGGIGMIVNLITGARNMKRDTKDKATTDFVTITVKNYTSYPMMISAATKTNCASLGNPLIMPGNEGSVSLGKADFHQQANPRNPMLQFSRVNGEESHQMRVYYGANDHYGQIRASTFEVSGADKVKDNTDDEVNDLGYTFWTTPKTETGLDCMFMMPPVSTGNCDATFLFID